MGKNNLPLKIIAGTLLAIWLLLIALGKSGFVHLLLLSAICIAVVEAVRTYRSQVKI